MPLPQPLRGIVTPLITPLAGPDELDPAGLERLVEHLLDGGVHGIFLLGTTGEGPSVSAKVRRDIVARTCRLVNGRIPVLVGVTDIAFADSVALARHAAERGADAVVSAGPLYFPVTQDLVLRHFERLAAQLPLPVILYNAPSCAHVFIEADTVGRAAALPNVAGIKDSSGNMGYLHQVRRAVGASEGFTVLVGPEELLAESVLLGVHGGVSGGSNLFPRLYVSLYEAALRGDIESTRRLHGSVIEVCARIFEAGSYGEHYLQGLKYAASLLGLCGECVAMPYGPLDDAGRGRVAASVESLKSLPGVAA
jgi:dihydrodipicolinate synthase/N-acetylneuraminate lyase